MVLFLKKNYDSVLLRCLEKEDVDRVLKDIHKEPAGGHLFGNMIAHNKLISLYYLPTLFIDSPAHARKCKTYQLTARKENKPSMPLYHVSMQRPLSNGEWM